MRIKQRTFPLKLKIRNSRIMRQSVRPQKQVQGLNHSQTNSNCQIDYDWNDGTQNQEKKFVVRGGVVPCCVVWEDV